MKVENFFTELEELMQDFAMFRDKKEVELIDSEMETMRIWAEFRRYIQKHDTVSLDWNNQDQEKFFVYAFTDSGELRIGKTTKFITPFVCYASSPQIIKGAVDHIGEEKLKRFGGLVYPEFSPDIHVVEPFKIPFEWYDTISIDPGLHNPLSAHWYAVDFDGNVWVVAEHFFAEKTVEWHAEQIKKKCKELNWPVRSDGKIEALIDSAANQKTLAGNKSVTELFWDNGILVNPKVNKDLFSGISRVKSYLKNVNGHVKLKIFSTCVNLIRELKNYWWGEGDNPIKKDDHALDELRYYIMQKPEASSFDCDLTDVQKHKEKLMKKIRLGRRRH